VFSSETGHYTQVVWKSTTHLGCATYGRHLVCQYGPSGNFKGRFTQNVLRPVKSASQCGGSTTSTPAGPTRSPTPRPTPTPICLIKDPNWICKGKMCYTGQKRKDVDRWSSGGEPYCLTNSKTSTTCARTDLDRSWCRGQCNCPRSCPHACGRCPPKGSSRAPSPAPSPRPSPASQGKQLQEKYTKKCISDDGGTLNYKPCNQRDPSQLWGVGPGGAYQNAKTGKCMGVGSYAC